CRNESGRAGVIALLQLRHTFASTMLSRNAPLLYVQQNPRRWPCLSRTRSPARRAAVYPSAAGERGLALFRPLAFPARSGALSAEAFSRQRLSLAGLGLCAAGPG